MNDKPKILIVDDREENLIALERLLADFNAEFVRAFSGNEALTKTLDENFALALIDVQMPGMDGYETVRLMRKVKQTMYLPIIFISAIFSENHYLVQGIETGAVDFITKPISPSIIIGKVRVFLDLYNQRRALEIELEKHKKLEESLEKTQVKLLEAKKRAEDADKQKTTFLANMSHEIRTPMNAIIGFSNLLAKENLPEDMRLRYVNYINNSSQNLMNLINDIIDFSKIEAGQLKIHKTIVNLKEELEELEATFDNEIKKKEKLGVSLILKIEKELPKNQITDLNRFRQVLSNLLNNAIKFTEEGVIEFGYRTIQGKDVYFVSDTGMGIPKEKLQDVFNRFERLAKAEHGKTSGFGLGLSIARRIVNLLGGEIYVESEVGKGSLFYFTIPDDELKQIKKEEKKSEEKPKKSDNNWEDKTILIAEDEDLNFHFLSEALRSTKVKIIWAKNGREAVDIFSENKEIEAVLMDLKMPEMDGYEAMKQIKASNPEMPVIAQTAYAMLDDKRKTIDAGFDEYLSKPINMGKLIEVLSHYLYR